MMKDQFGSLPYVPVPPVVQFGKNEPSLEQLIAAANRARLQNLAVRGSYLVQDQYLEPGSHPSRIRHPAFLQDDPIRRGPPIGPAGGVTPSPPPSPGMFRSALGNILGGLDKAQTVFASDPSGMTPYPGPDWLQTLLTYDAAQHLPWERRSVPGISYTDDQKERLEEIKIRRDSGELSDWQAAEEARKVHEELPFWGEIIRETLNPLGIVSMGMGGPAVAGTKALFKQGTAQTRRIPGVGPGLATGLETAGRVPGAILKTPVTAVKMTGIARHFKKPATAAQITEAQKAVGGIQKTGNVTHVASIDTMINQIQPGAGVLPRMPGETLFEYPKPFLPLPGVPDVSVFLGESLKFSGRRIAMVRLKDGTFQPFYKRTGGGGIAPEGAQPGDWTPFDGYATDFMGGWFNKAAYTKPWDGSTIPSHLMRWGTEENRSIGQALRKVEDTIQPARNIEDAEELNKWLGTKNLIGEQGPKIADEFGEWDRVIKSALVPDIPATTGTSFIARQTKRILDKYNVSPEWRRRIFFINPYAVADMQHPIEKIRVLLSRGVDDAEAHIGQLMNRINAVGNIDRLFKLDRYGMVHAPNIIASAAAGGKPVSKNVVFQNPEKYGLTPEQWAPLNEWYELADDAWRMLQKEGVDLPTKIQIGRYFPNYWKRMTDDKGKIIKTQFGEQQLPSRLRPFGIQRKNPLYQRFYQNVEDAAEAGHYSGASAREDMTTYFRFIYQTALEERVGKIVRTYSKTLSQRTVKDLTEQIAVAKTRRQGLSLLNANFKTIIDAQGWLMPGTNWRNRGLFAREAPELLRELEDPKWLSATVQERQQMLQKVKARLKTLQQEAAHEEKLKKNAQVNFKRRAAKKVSEMSMPTPRLRGQIFTPEEFVNRYSPTMDLNDVNFLTNDEIKRLTDLFEPHQNALLQSMTNINLAIRTTMAGFDFGAGQIHGALMMSTMPVQWAKVQAVSMRALFQPEILARKMKEHQSTVDILNNTGNLDAVQSDFVEAVRPGGLIHKLASGLEAPLGVDIPVWTKTVGKVPRLTIEAFERQFSGFITYGKVMAFEALQDTAIREGGPDALVELSQHVSKMFGTLSTRNLGTVPIFEQFLSAIPLFAPRYRMATWGLMLDATRGGMKGELARDALGKLALVGIMTHYAIAKGLGQEPKLDPTRGDFLTVQIGDLRVGWGTAYRSTVRMILATSRQMAEEGFVEGVRVDKYDNKLGRAIRYSTSPVVGTAWDTITGRSALGDPIDTVGDFIGKVPDWTFPFWLSGMMDNPRPGWHYMPLTAFGANAHAISDWDRYKQAVELTAEKEWNDIGKTELSLLLIANPELRELKNRAQSFWSDRGVEDDWTEWSNKSDLAKDSYNYALDEAVQEIYAASLDDDDLYLDQGKNFRERVSAASGSLAMDYRKRADEHPDLVKMMNEVSSDPDAPLLDHAKDEYMRSVVLGTFDIMNSEGESTGEFNYEAYRKAKNTFIEKWGTEITTKIQESLKGDKRNPPVLQMMNQDIDDIKVYWEVGEAIIKASGDTHLLTETEGKQMSIWSQYLSDRSHPDARKRLEADYPSLKDIYKAQTKARILLRERGDGQLEEKLIRWGYVNTARNRNNMLKPMSELRKIPLDYGRARPTPTPHKEE